jgi:heme A synthase
MVRCWVTHVKQVDIKSRWWENMGMKKITIGLLFGAIAGIIDIIPMIIQKLPLSANLSAFTMWVVVGFLIATSNLKLPPVLKGIAVACLVFASVGVLIGFDQAFTLIPIGVMLVVLGSGLGYAINKFAG